MDVKRPKGFLIENGKVDVEEPERQVREGRGWRVPNGGINSTIEDLSRFVTFELSGDSTVLSKKLLKIILKEFFSQIQLLHMGMALACRYAEVELLLL